MWRSRSSLITAALLSCLLLSVTVYYHRWDFYGKSEVIVWDIASYYIWLPAYFYGDLMHLSIGSHVLETYAPYGSDSLLSGNVLANGNYVLKTTCGLALLFTPAFALGHLLAMWGGYPMDGFSMPYQMCLALWAVVISTIGIFLSRKLLLRYFSEGVTSATLITLVLASNYFNYATFSGNHSHNYLFTLYAAILLVTDNYYRKPSGRWAVGMGFLCGFAVLIRPTELIVLLVPVFWGLRSWTQMKERLRHFLLQYQHLLLFGASALLIGSLQLIYWKRVTGQWVYWSYGPEEHFRFFRAAIHAYLFSYKKGWFTYTPVMLLSVAGIVMMVWKRINNAPLLLLFLVLNVWILSSWHNWWFGGSFSQRSIVQTYALLLLPIAHLFTHTAVTPVLKWLTATFVTACIWLNLVMTYQANVSGVMDSENMQAGYYWKIFGNPFVTQDDLMEMDTR